MLEQPSFEPACVFHSDDHAGQHALKDSRGREIKGRPNLAQILGDRVRTLRTVDTKPGNQAHGKREYIVPNPCHRQIGEHFFIGGDPVKSVGIACGNQKIFMREHHALWPPGRARGIEDDRGIGRYAFFDL